MSATVSTYQALLTGEYQGQPDLAAVIALSVEWSVDEQGLLAALQNTTFDLASAVGVQLDAVGVRVGRSRQIEVPLSGVYFSWDTAPVGWDQGTWQGPYDPSSGVVSLDDTSYRQLLSLVIAANNWDGTADAATEAIQAIFGSMFATTIFIEDNLDMSATVAMVGTPPSAVLQALFAGGYVPFISAGVKMYYVISSLTDPACVGFDTANNLVAGWDTGAWTVPMNSPLL